MSISAINGANPTSTSMFGRVKGFFANMNASEMAAIEQAGKVTQHEVPAGLGKLFSWAYRPFQAGKDGLLKKIGAPLVQAGFKLLQLPYISKISPFMKYNLLFGAGLALVGSAYNFIVGNIGKSIHGLVGNAITLGSSALAAYALPTALGMSTIGGPAAWMGFGITMFLEPKIRKLVGLDKHEPQAQPPAGMAGQVANGMESAVSGATPASQLASLLASQTQGPQVAQGYAHPYYASLFSNPYAYQQSNPWQPQQVQHPQYQQQMQQAAALQQQQQFSAQQATQQAEQLKLQQEAADDAKARQVATEIARSLKSERPI